MLSELLGMLNSNQLFSFLPILIIAHLVFSIWATLKQKIKFDWTKFPSFMKNGALFFVFLYMLEMFTTNGQSIGEPFNSFALALRSVSWFGIGLYYFSQIYHNLKIIGMPKVSQIEEEIQKHDEVTELKDGVIEQIKGEE